MPNLNKVMLMGNLTRDPEIKRPTETMVVTSIGVAVNRKWKSKAGEPQSETTFVDCDFFGKQAELVDQFFRKGNPIYVEGRLKLDQWKSNEGENRSKLKVIGESFEFLQTKAESQHTQSVERAPSPVAARANPADGTIPW